MKTLIKNHPFAVAVGALLALGTAGGGAAWSALHTEPTRAAAAPVAASVIDWGHTPAADAVRGALAAIPAGWTRRGDQLASVTPPFPLTCDPATVRPSYSASQQYNNGTTVVVASYTAGAGAVAMSQLRDHAYACAPAGTALTTTAVPGAGTESFGIRAARGGATSETAVVRRGDVIAFVLADGAPAAPAAAVVDRALADQLGACRNQNSTVADAARSTWTGAQFSGLLTDKKVTIGDWALPAVPPGSDYKAAAVPAGLTQVDEAARPEVPDFPVWPELPAEQKAPVLPAAPAAKATTEATVKVRIADPEGPGCGWAFTGTAAPVFDAAAVSSQNDAKVKDAEDQLDSGASKWSDSVLAYWKDIAAYQKAVASYSRYADALADADKAWAPIRAAWSDYRSKKADYDAAVAARDDFQRRKGEAQKAYDAAVQVCSAPDPVPSGTPSPSSPAPSSPAQQAPASPHPSATPAPTIAPAAFVVPKSERAGCPPSKPVILSQDAPSVPQEPKQPEDPRPKTAR